MMKNNYSFTHRTNSIFIKKEKIINIPNKCLFFIIFKNEKNINKNIVSHKSEIIIIITYFHNKFISFNPMISSF